jgi:predicted S18 family serine protease
MSINKKVFFSSIIIALSLGLIMGILFVRYFDVKDNRDYILLTAENEANLIIPAINTNGEGVTAILTTQLKTGSGLVLVNINDALADYELQYSARLATQSALNFSGKRLDGFDVIYNIKTDANFISGSSAGASMAISLISLLEEREINENVAITGTIKEDGSIGEVSGIIKKAEAVKKAGLEILLIPEESYVADKAERKISCDYYGKGEYCETRYVVSNEYEISGIKIIKVKNLNEAIEYFLKDG